MWGELLLRGILIGFLASIPLGPVGVLCIQRTLSKSHRSGFVSGLGAASADTIFAAIAFFALAFVLSFIRSHELMLRVIGGIIIIIVGVNIFLTNPVVQIRRNRAGKTNLWQDYITVFGITLANPAFILILIAMFAMFGVSSDKVGIFDGWSIIVGVFCGSAAWWFLLTFVVNLFRRRFRPRHMLWINRISGTLIVLLGAATIILMFFNVTVDGLLR